MDRSLEGALRDPRHAGALEDRQDGVSRVHPPHQLGRRGAVPHGEPRHPGHPAAVSRLRQAVAFLAGFLVGVVVLYALLLWKGELVRGPFASVSSAVPPTTLPPFTPSPAEPVRDSFASPSV